MRERRSRYEIYVNRRCMMKVEIYRTSRDAARGLVAVEGDEVVSISARHKFIGMDPPIWRET